MEIDAVLFKKLQKNITEGKMVKDIRTVDVNINHIEADVKDIFYEVDDISRVENIKREKNGV